MSQRSVNIQQGDYINGEDWLNVKNSLVKLYIQPQKNNLVVDQQMIISQNDLLQEIKQKIQRYRFKEAFGSMEILPIDSNISNINSAYNYGDDESFIKNKFTQEFESSLVNSALKQVKSSCSQQTFQTIRNYVLNNKQKQFQLLNKVFEKKNKDTEQLQLTIILKQNQIVKLKEQLFPFLENFNQLEDEKKKIKRKNDLITQKEKRIHKTEMALIFKEKMNQESKKRMERLKEFADNLYNKMRSIQKDLNKVWESILAKMQNNHDQKCCQTPDPKGCWKKQLMKKCRQKLLQQRDLLKQQQKQLEKEYEVLQTVSNQCKKLISQNQESLISNFSNIQNGPMSLVNSKDDLGKNFNSISLINIGNNKKTKQ